MDGFTSIVFRFSMINENGSIFHEILHISKFFLNYNKICSNFWIKNFEKFEANFVNEKLSAPEVISIFYRFELFYPQIAMSWVSFLKE